MAYNRHSRSLIRLIHTIFAKQVPILGAEIGVWKGHNAAMLLSAFPQLTLYTVDPWELGGDHVSMPKTTPAMFADAKKEFYELVGKHIERCKVLQMTSEQAAKEVPDGSLDFVFIDGDHTYESVQQDIELWYPKVKPTGMVSGHDYYWADGTNSLVVKQAVDLFAYENKYVVDDAPGQIWWFIKRMGP